MDIIEGTVFGKDQYDNVCKRMALGLIQDLCNGLQETIADDQDKLARIMNILFSTLSDGSIGADVQVIAILCVGEICLMTEKQFQPYFEQTMSILVSAG